MKSNGQKAMKNSVIIPRPKIAILSQKVYPQCKLASQASIFTSLESLKAREIHDPVRKPEYPWFVGDRTP